MQRAGAARPPASARTPVSRRLPRHDRTLAETCPPAALARLAPDLLPTSVPMHDLPVVFAVNGVLVLTSSMVSGLLLHRAIRRDADTAAWHLSHAGSSGRGLMLIALAGVVRWIALPPPHLAIAAGLLLFFAWTSTLAMLVGAVAGVRGQRWAPPAANRVVYALYVAGAVAVFPAMLLLVIGLARSPG